MVADVEVEVADVVVVGEEEEVRQMCTYLLISQEICNIDKYSLILYSISLSQIERWTWWRARRRKSSQEFGISREGLWSGCGRHGPFFRSTRNWSDWRCEESFWYFYFYETCPRHIGNRHYCRCWTLPLQKEALRPHQEYEAFCSWANRGCLDVEA